jgi:anti-sigma B factor antagonist
VGAEAVEFTIRREDTGIGCVVTVVGELDARTAPRLREALIAAVQRGPVTVDVGDAAFMDSTGLGVVVGGHKRAGKAGVGFTVLNPSRQMTKVFEVTGLRRVLEVRHSVDAPTSRPPSGAARSAGPAWLLRGRGHGPIAEITRRRSDEP